MRRLFVTILLLLANVATHAADAVALKKSCDAGAMVDCTQLGRLYAEGTGVEKDLGKAVQLYATACNANEPTGCFFFAFYADRIPNVASRPAFFMKSCDLGYAKGCEVGVASVGGQDPSLAIPFLEKGCALNDGSACERLAKRYLEGKGVTADANKAAAIYLARCDAGHGYTCAALATLYYSGPLPLDKQRAFELYMKGCDNKVYLSCNNAAVMLLKGDGVPLNRDRALAMYESECDRKQTGACNVLAAFYSGKAGFAKDTARAVAAMERGCKYEDMQACFSLSDLYSNGTDVPRDEKLASRYYNSGCRIDPEVCE